jgi:NADPH2 dehydrogenase
VDGLLKLFEPFSVKNLHLKNRIMMSPMCQYSVWDHDGTPNAWHQTHYISRAVGGVGLVMMEMTDVLPDGRITVRDLGLWDDQQIGAYAAIINEVHRYGAKAGIQIAHAGRKAESPELTPVAPSAIAFSDRYRVPHALTTMEVEDVVEAFYRAAKRAVEAGVDTLELHGAHGYLIHQFLSPLSNHRDDRYGERPRFAIEVAQAVRSAIGPHMALWMRLSAVEYDPDGYDFAELMSMAGLIRDAGVDGFDVSSGGNAPRGPAFVFPGYQVGYAAAMKHRLQVPIIALGMLESYPLAESVLQRDEADMIAIGRGLLADPYWPNSAARALGGHVQVPAQYDRAFAGSFVERKAP